MSTEQERDVVLRFVYEHGPLTISDLRKGIGSQRMSTVNALFFFFGFLNIEGPKDKEGDYEEDLTYVRLSKSGIEEALKERPKILTLDLPPSSKKAKKPKSAAYRKMQAACQLAESRNRDAHTSRWRP